MTNSRSPSGLSRRRFLQSAAALGCLAHTPAFAGEAPEPALKTRAAAKGLEFGAAEVARYLLKDPALAQAYVRECAVLVAADDLKWGSMRRKPGKIDFTMGDALYLFAHSHGMAFRGHTLLWHYDLPRWVDDIPHGPPARALLEEHIWSVVGRYRGHMHSWDVVNEALHPRDGRSDGLRESYWLKAIGPEYIELAFRTAHAADPDAVLVYNDYDFTLPGSDNNHKRYAILKLLEDYVKRGVPIHAIGLQSHLMDGRGWFKPRLALEFLDELQNLGLRALITELDVRDDNLPADVARRDARVADMMSRYLEELLPHPTISSVITWGLSDKYTYMNEFYPREDGLPTRPLPLDDEFARKPAWYAIARALDQAPARAPLARPPRS